LNGTYATTGSNTFTGIQTVNSNLVVTGSITAQTLVVQTITSSVDFVTGSTRFGSILGNTHVFSGSVTMNPGGLFVSSSGAVGIGVIPTQTSSLVFADTLSSKILLNNNTNNYRIDLTSSINGGDAMMKFIAGSTGAGEVGFYTTTNLRMIITSGGRVGIGTSSPSSSLTVNGIVRAFGNQVDYVLNATGSTQYSRLSFEENGTEKAQLQYINSAFSSENRAGRLEICNASSGSTGIAFVSAVSSFGSPQMFINPSGNVGIGTTTPLREAVLYRASGEVHFKLANGTTGQTITDGFDIAIDTTGNAYFIQRENLALSFYTNATERIFITSAGNVGINTSSPESFGAFAVRKSVSLNSKNVSVSFSDATNSTFDVRHPAASTVDLSSQNSALTFSTSPTDSNGIERMRISTAGYITTPAQPAFYAYLPGGATTTTTGNYAGFNTTRLNRGSHYSTSTGRFTAPVAGVYRFLFAALYRRQSGTASGEISISINGSNINGRGLAYVVNNVVDGHTPVVAELIISLNANDYVMPFIYSVGSGSDFYMGENLAYFGGYLIG
jgi:hypothetical protein